MGLDMYFYMEKSEFQSRWSERKNVELEYDEELKELENALYQTSSKSIIISYKIGYFRKFNALHSYIVENFAKGVDECQRIDIDKKQLKEMLDTLKNVKKTNANIVLPTQEGFFFGSREYDEDYFIDIKEAITLFERVLKILENDTKYKWDFYYRASW